MKLLQKNRDENDSGHGYLDYLAENTFDHEYLDYLELALTAHDTTDNTLGLRLSNHLVPYFIISALIRYKSTMMLKCLFFITNLYTLNATYISFRLIAYNCSILSLFTHFYNNTMVTTNP